MIKYLFVVLAGHKYGLGHLKRCILIAKKLEKHHITFLLIGGNKKANTTLIDNKIFNIFSLKISDRIDSTKIKNLIFKYDKVIFDISNKSNLNFSILASSKFFLNKKSSNKVIIIDAKYSESVLSKNTKIPVDLAIIPYFNENMINISSLTSYIGEKYAVLDDLYKTKKKRKLNTQVKKIFISFGGADSRNFTLKTLKSISQLNEKFQINISIGLFFSKKQITTLKIFSDSNNLNVKFLFDIDLLRDHFYWSDFSIIGSGLTKYEMLATGTPGISISLNGSDYQSNNIISNKKAIVNLRYDISIKDLSKKILKLARNCRLRSELSTNARSLVDGRGLHRVTNAIEKL